MIDKKIIGIVPKSKKYVGLNVLFQWLSLISNIVIIFTIVNVINSLYKGTYNKKLVLISIVIFLVCMVIRYFCIRLSSKMSFLSSKSVKRVLREKIYNKLLALGENYDEKLSTSEVVQVTVEGVDQLETYFGSYLPQFFYSMLAPLTLFAVLSTVSLSSAAVLLACVPLIPITIALVQTFAKKLLGKYWGEYTTLGDTFLENLQGLTTLKIYEADEFKNIEMNKESERFRKITMKVLSMQLNSIIIMDVIAYGGAAVGIIMAVHQLRAGNIDLAGALVIILLSAEFFIPMRMLGSFFHIAMNGMAASDKIFKLLETEEPQEDDKDEFPSEHDIRFTDVDFSYEDDRKVIHGADLYFKEKGLTAIVGESGSGKSTVAGLIMGRNTGYCGEIKIGGVSLDFIKEKSILENITYVGFNSYLFKGTVKENLLMGKPDASDNELIEVLKKVNLWEFLCNEDELDTQLLEKASNLSGGQRQRLVLARAILHDTPVYIFDEATSNIDVESEEAIIDQMYELAKTKSVIMITHRLANALYADNIYVMEKGVVKECGNHGDLVEKNGIYNKLLTTQNDLENYRKGIN